MATKKDYYDVLGIAKGSSDEQIKQAYRKLAREWHPDMVKDTDKSKAEERFKEINEAYQVLSDSQKKKAYDQFGHAGASGFSGQGGQGHAGGWGPFSYSYSSSGGQGFGDVDPFDIFEEFFGGRGFPGGRSPKKGKNLYYELHLDFGSAIRGIEKTVKVESGSVVVKVPAGVKDGIEMRFVGKGMPGPDNLPSGDLYIKFRVSIPKEFELYGDNLLVGVEIDFTQATLGDVIEVPVVDISEDSGVGRAKLKIPSGTQHGSNFRVKGKGMPRLNSSSIGDVIVQVFVKIPTRLNKKQKELLEELKKAS